MKAIILSAAVLCVAVSAAMAKSHDQGNTAVPGGEDVGTVTVTNAQALGGVKGKRPADKGPSADNPAAGKAGR